MPSMCTSAAKGAAPVTLSAPSRRETGAPINPCSRWISGSGSPPGSQLSGPSGTAVFAST